MKNFIFSLVLIFVSNTIFAQTGLDKYDGQEGVTSIVVNKKMFQMMASVKIDAKDKETQQYLNLIRKLDNLKVFTTTNSKIAADMKVSADAYMKTAGLEEMSRLNNGGRKVKIGVKSGATEGQIKELLMLGEDASRGNETTLLSLTGDFTLDEIMILMNKMKIPGSDVLTKTSK